MNKNRKRYLGGIFCIVVLMMGIFILTACGQKEQEAEKNAVNTEVGEILLETKYLTIRIPDTFGDKLIHRESVQDNNAVEIFSMALDDTEMELFRLYFNDANMGTQNGYLLIGADEISVSHYVCIYEDEDFADESIKEQYYRIMDVFTYVMDNIYNHPQFQQEKYIASVGQQENKMMYWSVELPENVNWQEQTIDGTYRADFYGEIQGETIQLYTIALGDMDADYSIGAFLIDGEEKTVWVKIYDLEDHANWQEEDYSNAYRMMESVNNVIDQILASEFYTEY